jgi:murein DD-endopeptidase MepM/ murein hydrolase activator NlpD
MRKSYIFLGFFLLIGSLILISFFQNKNVADSSSPEVVVSTGTFARGDSLYSCLSERGVSPGEILALKKLLDPLFDTRKCYPGDSYEIITSTSGVLEGFNYYSGPLDIYGVKKSPSGELIAFHQKIPLEKRILGLIGEIEASLYESMIQLGQPPELTMRFADIFAWQIDFLTEPRPGDKFKLVWEKFYRNGEEFSDGAILAAQYLGKEVSHTAILFEDPEGLKDYYTIKGESLRKEFLRSPLNYRRISSYFSYKRFHPILKYYRPHLGIDYAAPSGTPVASIGDGVVTYVGWKGEYGRFVKVRHQNGYYSTYGHLSRYERGIKRGVKVKQGQVVGYVGASGLATGPHLDFRLIRNGSFINFLKIQIPAAESVKERYRKEFEITKRERLSQVGILSSYRSFPHQIVAAER